MCGLPPLDILNENFGEPWREKVKYGEEDGFIIIGEVENNTNNEKEE